MRFVALICGLLALGWAHGALATTTMSGIGSPVVAGGGVTLAIQPNGPCSGAPGTCVATTVVDSPIGSRIDIYIGQVSLTGTYTATDTVGNTYAVVPGTLKAGATGQSVWLRGVITIDLPIGDQITITSTDSTTNHWMVGSAVTITRSTGSPSVDLAGAGATGSTSPATIAGGSTSFAPEISLFGIFGPGAPSNYTFTGGYALTNADPNFGGRLQVAQLALAATGAQTPSATFSGSHEWEANILTEH